MRTLGRVNRIAPRVLKTDPFSVFRWYNFYKGWVVELCNWLCSAVAALFAGGRWTRAVSGKTLGEKQYEVDMWTRRPSLVWFAKSYLPEDYRRSRKLSAADADGFDRANTRPITSFQQFNCWTSSNGNRFNKGQRPSESVLCDAAISVRRERVAKLICYTGMRTKRARQTWRRS